jgi:hypothetical protein
MTFSERKPQRWFGPDDFKTGTNPVAAAEDRDAEIRAWEAERARRLASASWITRVYWFFADPAGIRMPNVL